MHITQAVIGPLFFREAFLRKWKLTPLTNNQAPALFFGCYYQQVASAMNVTAPLILVWIGSDALHARKYSVRYAPLLARNDIRHIALSSMVSNTLTSLSIPHEVIPITPFEYKEFTLTPLGDQVYYYGPHRNREVYGVKVFKSLIPLLDNAGIPYIRSDSHHYPREIIHNIYSQSCCNLRLNTHDGFPNTVVEMALMGRRSAWNGNAPGCVQWATTGDLITFINHELQREAPCKETREAMLDYINIGRDWMRL